ncbi:MAG TPA: hypothetical protein PKY82_08605 [Pyrinomonadaceae bacterium]|nr:hypothetical protein [Pyrinomonadaceae bacterium]
MDCRTNQNLICPENQAQNKTEKTTTESSFDDIFNQTWEVFVVKLDEETGKHIGKVACCALQPV